MASQVVVVVEDSHEDKKQQSKKRKIPSFEESRDDITSQGNNKNRLKHKGVKKAKSIGLRKRIGRVVKCSESKESICSKAGGSKMTKTGSDRYPQIDTRT